MAQYIGAGEIDDEGGSECPLEQFDCLTGTMAYTG